MVVMAAVDQYSSKQMSPKDSRLLKKRMLVAVVAVVVVEQLHYFRLMSETRLPLNIQ